MPSDKECCIPGCLKTSASHPALHVFPNPVKDLERFNTWVSTIGGHNLNGLSNEHIFKYRRVCHTHFEQKYLCRYNRLSKIAVPTINIPERSVVRENNGNGTDTTNVTPQSKGNNDKNITSELTKRRLSCDTIDSLKSSGIQEDPLAIESDEVADRTVSDSESYLEDIDEEILEWSDGIFEEFAQKWEPILKKGLIKRTQDEINSNYLFCRNIPSSKPAVLNTEIANLLTEEIKSRDNELVNKQSQLGHALAALGKAMTGLRTNTMETSDILETLNDVGELIADLHYLETETRRSLIIQELDKSFALPLKDRVRDEYLFGQDVGELLKPPEVKTTASSITPRMISTFLNKKKMKRPPAPIPVRQMRKKNMKRPAAPTPVYQITKKPRECIDTSLTILRTREEDLPSDMDTAAPDPDPDQTTTDPTAALSQLNNIQIYDENCQPLSPEQQPAPSLTNETEILIYDENCQPLSPGQQFAPSLTNDTEILIYDENCQPLSPEQQPAPSLTNDTEILIYDENGQPLSPGQQPAPSLTNDTEILVGNHEETGKKDVCIILLDEILLT